ncbi:2-C-methyl-D-erythritol 2,4-cyclodiphosphate synthase, partial [bacterium]|nr:2-C-methyl-D-erythritol 2,4-cyclodiphosphate synthase [bacterium]
MRIGTGYDIHRLIPTVKMEKIPVGGVEIPCYYRVQAHSDGDVLVHALIDACLGALALGDIGQWFPDTAKEHQDRKSLEFLRPVLQELKKLGYRVNQMDSTL